MAVAIYAILMQLGKGKNAWQYVWIIPIVYAMIAGIEALLAGSFVGLMCVQILRLLLLSYGFCLLITTLLDWEQFTMRDTFRCQHGFHLYGH